MIDPVPQHNWEPPEDPTKKVIQVLVILAVFFVAVAVAVSIGDGTSGSTTTPGYQAPGPKNNPNHPGLEVAELRRRRRSY